MTKVKLLEFAERYIFLGDELIRFDDRPYLPEVYAAAEGNLVLRCSRQSEKSTMLVNIVVFLAVMHPGITILICCPREDQSELLVKMRLIPVIQNSAFPKRVLIGNGNRRLSTSHLEFANGSRVIVRAAFHSADAARGISSDVIILDEFQDLAEGNLPVLMESMSHSKWKQLIAAGTPKATENHLETLFQQSTACEWQVPCPACTERTILDEKVIGLRSLCCPKCESPIDTGCGTWLPRNPDSKWGKGFWINHCMVPWVQHDELLAKRAEYDPIRFRNECLGLPTVLGDRIVSREEVEACCHSRNMATRLEDVPRDAPGQLVAGIDWGGGANSTTVLVIGYMRSDKIFHVCRFDRFRANEDTQYLVTEVAKKCREFRICTIAADGGGNGHVCNRWLAEVLQLQFKIYSIFYSTSEQKPYSEGHLKKWTVDRSATLGQVFTRIKTQKIMFPPASDCGSFLDEFLAVYEEYDSYNRRIRYAHPENQLDDTVHAVNYALIIADQVREAIHGNGVM